MTNTRTDWAQDYMDSVAWGDEIEQGFLTGSWIEYCRVEVDGVDYYDVPGHLTDLNKALADAEAVKEATGGKVAILFVDKQATEAQVEEAMHRACDVGIGCGFLEAKLKLHQYGLLNKYSEGTLLEQALKVMQEGSN